MEPTKELLDDIYREKVVRARSTPAEEKFLAGPRLFEFACWMTIEGIRNQNPGASEEDVRRILAERLALRERMETQN
ncbi:MAG: hypothetical protein HYS13_25445 [Planctomycetia bacterium]|nr:hypothetical protein [Planctomycetia bacterium]